MADARRECLRSELNAGPGRGDFFVASSDLATQTAYTAEQLADAVASGDIGPERMVWRAGMPPDVGIAGWQTVAEFAPASRPQPDGEGPGQSSLASKPKPAPDVVELKVIEAAESSLPEAPDHAQAVRASEGAASGSAIAGVMGRLQARLDRFRDSLSKPTTRVELRPVAGFQGEAARQWVTRVLGGLALLASASALTMVDSAGASVQSALESSATARAALASFTDADNGVTQQLPDSLQAAPPAGPVTSDAAPAPGGEFAVPRVVQPSGPAHARAVIEAQFLRPVTVVVDGKSYEAIHPLERVRLCREAAEAAGLRKVGADWRDIYAVVHAESAWADRDGMGRNGRVSRGIAQLEDQTSRLLGIDDPHDVKQALKAVAALVKEASAWGGRGAGKASLSVYYNLSTKARNEWDRRTVEDLPRETQYHIANVAGGLKVATALGLQRDAFDARMRRLSRDRELAQRQPVVYQVDAGMVKVAQHWQPPAGMVGALQAQSGLTGRTLTSLAARNDHVASLMRASAGRQYAAPRAGG